MTSRAVKNLHLAYRDDIGDLQTRRPLPGPAIPQLDPFLFLNHHGPQTYAPNNRGLPFGPHPHRGFETVTFILEGELTHRDSAGHGSVITAGGVQWMTAGKGVVHSETSSDAFLKSGGPLEILQLWVNLPGKLKMSNPRYTGLQRGDIPALKTPDGLATVNLISGAWNGKSGPVTSLTGVFMSVVELKGRGRATFDVPAGRNIFFYVARGTVHVGGKEAKAFTLVEFERDGDNVAFEAATDALVVFGHADPIGEPVVAHGPFVMNTREEIQQAYADFRTGRFEAALS